VTGLDPPAPTAPPRTRARLGRFQLTWPGWLPKTIFATIGITLLSAWLFPALSRQWQDRQKARELTAGLVSEIGEQTSQTLVTSDFFSAGRDPFVINGRFSQHLFNQLDLNWRKANAQVEAELQAYYSDTILDRWKTYARLVQKTYFLATPDMYQRAGTLAELREHFGEQNWKRWHGALLATPWVEKSSAVPQVVAYLHVTDALSDEKAKLIDDMLDDHPAGFSTRPMDIVHGLIPFY
jgi:hypothetical protein